MAVVTREIEVTEAMLSLAAQQKDSAFGALMEDRVVAMVRDGGTWRAVEQIGHRYDAEQTKAVIYLPHALRRSLESDGQLIPERLRR